LIFSRCLYYYRQVLFIHSLKGSGVIIAGRYSYAREWAGRAIDSAHFKKPEGHANPARMAYESKTVIADDVRLGAYRLPDFLVRKIGNETPLTLDNTE